MNVQVAPRPTSQAANASKLATADCDIHPQRRSAKDLHPYLAQRWIEHMQMFGARPRQAYQNGPAYPKGQPNAARRDAWPPGGKPGSDLPFLREQLLDANNCVLGVLNATGDNGQSYQNREFGAAVCHAMNEWLIHEWLDPEPRLKGSLVVPYEDADAAVQEIERYAGDPRFVQVLMLNRTSEPAGQKRYWKVYEAAAAANLPIGVHAFGFGGHASSGSGWPSYYIEDMVGHAQSCQAFLSSMIVEGVFERLPTLKLVMIEGGFAWMPPMLWRLDKLWKTLRAETPHLRMLPSEYAKRQIWLTTQPMEEPIRREQVLDTIEWIGWDRLLFATDYPHWDYDDPAQVLPMPVAEEKKRGFFLNNAVALYGQG